MLRQILQELYANRAPSLGVTLLELGTLALLTGYLALRLRKRMREQTRPHTAHWTGKAIDTTLLKPAVDRARRHGWRAHPIRGVYFHKALLLLIRRNVTRFEYFQERKSEEHQQA